MKYKTILKKRVQTAVDTSLGKLQKNISIKIDNPFLFLDIKMHLNKEVHFYLQSH